MAITNPNVWNGHLGPKKLERTHDYMVIGDRAYKIHKVIVHKFQMGDVEDPDLYAAGPLLDWQNSEMGKWVMSKSVETPMWHRWADPMTFGYSYVVQAWLKDIDYTFWQLKWGQNPVDNKYF